MNNEPVAYVDPIWMDRPDLVMSHQLEIGKLFARTQFKNYVPLYTQPPDEFKDEWIPLYTQQRPHNTVLVPCDKLAEMQAEIEALKAHPVKEQDESFDRTASHMAGEYVSYKTELTDEEITEIYKKVYEEGHENQVVALAKEILRKAQEK